MRSMINTDGRETATLINAPAEDDAMVESDTSFGRNITGIFWPVNLKAEYPNELHRHQFRVEKDGSISAVNSEGERLTFRDWQSFSDVASGRR